MDIDAILDGPYRVLDILPARMPVILLLERVDYC